MKFLDDYFGIFAAMGIAFALAGILSGLFGCIKPQLVAYSGATYSCTQEVLDAITRMEARCAEPR